MERVKRLLVSMAAGGAVALVVYVASQTLLYYPFVMVQNLIDDSHFVRRFQTQAATGAPGGSIVIVDIDDLSLDRLGGQIDLWPRRHFAQVTENLARDGAAVIFLDVLFAEGGSERWNAAFAQSVGDAGNVVAGYFVNVDRASRYQRPPDSVLNERFITRPEAHLPNRIRLLSSDRVSFSYRELVQASAGIGYANYQPDIDGVLRHIPLFMQYQQWIIPSASLQLWFQLTGRHDTDALIGTDGVFVGDFEIPADRHTFMRINYRGAENVYRRISFSDVQSGRYEPGTFTDKIVLVGSSAPRLGDLKLIPGKQHIPGVEVHAAALDTIISGRFLRIPGDNLLFVLNLLTGIAAGALFRFTHPLRGGLAGLVTLPLVFFGAAMICFSSCNLLVNTSIPTCTVLAAYLFVTFYHYCRTTMECETGESL